MIKFNKDKDAAKVVKDDGKVPFADSVPVAEKPVPRPEAPEPATESTQVDSKDYVEEYPHRRFWLQVSENVAGFLNFHPQFKFFSTKNEEQEAMLSGFIFEVTEEEYMKHQPAAVKE